MEAATVAAPRVVQRPHDTVAHRVGRVATKLPFQILMAVLALAWLVPTFALLLTSLMPAGLIDKQGWWKVVSHPSQMTLNNYDALLKNNDLTKSLVTTTSPRAGPGSCNRRTAVRAFGSCTATSWIRAR